MKRFFFGAFRNFVVLLLAFTGIKLWRDGQGGLAIVCFAALVALIVWQVFQLRDRMRARREEEEQ